MDLYKRIKIIFLITTVFLLILAIPCFNWLIVNIINNQSNWNINNFKTILNTLIVKDYLLLIIGLTIIQEAGMIFCRYVLGLRGKKERMYLLWKNKKVGLHHFHWGLFIVICCAIAEITETSVNLLMIAVGLSFMISDVCHHMLLTWLHGDDEGDGPLRFLK